MASLDAIYCGNDANDESEHCNAEGSLVNTAQTDNLHEEVPERIAEGVALPAQMKAEVGVCQRTDPLFKKNGQEIQCTNNLLSATQFGPFPNSGDSAYSQEQIQECQDFFKYFYRGDYSGVPFGSDYSTFPQPYYGNLQNCYDCPTNSFYASQNSLNIKEELLVNDPFQSMNCNLQGLPQTVHSTRRRTPSSIGRVTRYECQEDRVVAQRRRNRQSAQAHRDRQKLYMMDLAMSAQSLHFENEHLRKRNMELEAAKTSLECQVLQLQKQLPPPELTHKFQLASAPVISPADSSSH